MPDSRLHQLSALGQSVWIDFLSRDLVQQGELARMMDEDAVTGVTSNPTIFQKAISQGSAYDDQLRDLVEHEDDAKEIFIALAGRDVGDACDLMRSVWDGGAGLRGYVSMEVDPTLAYDADGTLAEAKRLHALVDKANLYVKIPATRRWCRADRGDDRAGEVDQRHADLLAGTPSRGDGGLYPRDRALRRGRAAIRGPSRRSRATSSRASTPRRTSGSKATRSSRASSRSRTRSSRTRTGRRSSPASAGRRSRRRARRSSGACGRRPRRRTRPTVTCSTSRI